MNKIIRNMFWLLSTVFVLLSFTQCKDDDEFVGKDYGYVQFKLLKKGAATKAVSLNNLSEAKKIKIFLVDGENHEIEQTLNVDYFNETTAEYGVRTEVIKMLIGNYTVKGYAIYDGQNDEPILKGDMDETVTFAVTDGYNTVVNLPLDVLLKGRLFFILGKDDTAIRPKSKAVTNSETFEYSDIRSINVTLKDKNNGNLKKYTFKVTNTNRISDRELYQTDTLNVPVGDYSVTLYAATSTEDGNGTTILAESSDTNTGLKDIQILDATMRKDTLVMKLPQTEAIKDYLALYTIWKNMNGENWYYRGESATVGANWVFEGRTVDTWGKQFGVEVDSDGRVVSLNIGSFNPAGDLPDAIGQLTELNLLYLGTHSEEDGPDPFDLEQKGISYKTHRMEIAKEASASRQARNKQALLKSNGYIASKLTTKETHYKYVTTYDAIEGTRTNTIKSISKEIGKLTKLEQLFIANGLIKELPAEIANLASLTDLEIYNCPITEFPSQIINLPLVSVNLSYNYNLSPAKMEAGLEALCNGEAAKTLQLLYVNQQKITRLPDNMKNLNKLGLLDVSSNKISYLPAMKTNVTKEVNLVEVYLDNNELTDIPDDFCGTNDMEKFSASNNKIEYFPNVFTALTLYQLAEIDLSINQIRGFKADFKGFRTEELDLSMNCFDKNPTHPGWMPEEFGKTWHGKVGTDIDDYPNVVNNLVLNQCGIDSIPENSVKNLYNVTALSLVGNNLKALPFTFGAETMPYLSGIDLSFNNFTDIPVKVLNIPGMTQIVMEHQYDKKTGKRVMKTFQSNIYKHPSLKILYLGGNDIISISPFPSNLNVLAIADNPNLEMEITTEICDRITAGTFLISYDKTQSGITGCPILDIE